MQDRIKWAIALGACCVLLAAALIAAIVDSGNEDASASRNSVSVRPLASAVTPEEGRQILEKASSYEPPDMLEETRAIVSEYRAFVEQNPTDPETAVRLMALANLYQYKLFDYDEAVWCYQHILAYYPDYPSRADVYTELAACYKRMGAFDRVRRVYMDMLREFPEDSAPHQTAQRDLDMEFGEDVEGEFHFIVPIDSDEEEEMSKDEGEDEDEDEGEGEGEGEHLVVIE